MPANPEAFFKEAQETAATEAPVLSDHQMIMAVAQKHAPGILQRMRTHGTFIDADLLKGVEKEEDREKLMADAALRVSVEMATRKFQEKMGRPPDIPENVPSPEDQAKDPQVKEATRPFVNPNLMIIGKALEFDVPKKAVGAAARAVVSPINIPLQQGGELQPSERVPPEFTRRVREQVGLGPGRLAGARKAIIIQAAKAIPDVAEVAGTVDVALRSLAGAAAGAFFLTPLMMLGVLTPKQFEQALEGAAAPIVRVTRKKKGPTGKVVLPASQEAAFQRWYAGIAQRLGINPDPDHPQQFFDYRAAFLAGNEPDASGHFSSEFKLPGHPREIVDGVNTRTGERVNGSNGR